MFFVITLSFPISTQFCAGRAANFQLERLDPRKYFAKCLTHFKPSCSLFQCYALSCRIAWDHSFNPLMPGANKKVTPFCYHQALKG